MSIEADDNMSHSKGIPVTVLTAGLLFGGVFLMFTAGCDSTEKRQSEPTPTHEDVSEPTEPGSEADREATVTVAATTTKEPAEKKTSGKANGRFSGPTPSTRQPYLHPDSRQNIGKIEGSLKALRSIPSKPTSRL